LILPNAVLTHLKAGVRADCLPLPVFIELCRHAAWVTAAKHARPSETILAPGLSAPCELADRKPAEGFDGPKDDLIWLAIVRCRDRSDERRLACCAAPAAAAPSAADIGVVHPDVAFQAFARVALQHDLSELVLHNPSSRLGDAEASTEFDTGNALL
jgi:hypothetical protein